MATIRATEGDMSNPLFWYLIGLALGGALVWAVQRG